MRVNSAVLHNRPFLAGLALGLVPAMEFVLGFGRIFTFDVPVRASLFTMLLLFALISSLYGIFGLIVIRLATTLERQFVDVYESPAATNDRYQTVKNSLLVGVILLSYALFPIGRFVGIPFLFFFGWVIPGLGIAAVVLITPIAWALLRRRAL